MRERERGRERASAGIEPGLTRGPKRAPPPRAAHATAVRDGGPVSLPRPFSPLFSRLFSRLFSSHIALTSFSSHTNQRVQPRRRSRARPPSHPSSRSTTLPIPRPRPTGCGPGCGPAHLAGDVGDRLRLEELEQALADRVLRLRRHALPHVRARPASHRQSAQSQPAGSGGLRETGEWMIGARSGLHRLHSLLTKVNTNQPRRPAGYSNRSGNRPQRKVWPKAAEIRTANGAEKGRRTWRLEQRRRSGALHQGRQKRSEATRSRQRLENPSSVPRTVPAIGCEGERPCQSGWRNRKHGGGAAVG